jgi:drug/metabolite transporter (DMT)-like permease
MVMVNKTAFGFFAAIFTVLIWASFMLVTRLSLQGNFTVEEIITLRLLPAFLIMSPFMFKLGVIPHKLRWPKAIILMFGASAITPYLIAGGLVYAPVSDGGALAPGVLPFWTALAAYIIIGEKPSVLRWVGLVMIMGGAMVVGLWQILMGTGDGSWKGHIMFLAGAGIWAVHSVFFKQSGLSPTQALVIGTFWGTVFFVPVLFLTGNVSFETVGVQNIIVMIILQGFVMGIFAMLLFSYAVQFLGASETAAFGALIPIISLIGGVVLLNETVPAFKLAGIVLVSIGVFLASGLADKLKNKSVS